MGEIIRHTTQEQRDVVNGIDAYEDYSTAELLSEQPVTTVDFNLKKSVDLTVAKEVKETLKNAEEEKRVEENMKSWRLQLSSIDSDLEKIRIAMEFDIDILLEALRRNVERVDNTHNLFCKKEDRTSMHSEALSKIKDDMMSEYEEIQPYLEEAESFIKMIGRKE